MQYHRFTIKGKEHNHFFIRLLSSILISVLVLITTIFILIYSNLSDQSLRSAYTAEQENIANISHSAMLADDAALSVLNHLYNTPRIRQLVYTNQLKNNTSINSMLLFKEYIKASSWVDSAYILNVNMDTVIYAGSSDDKHSHVVSFTRRNEFWDSQFMENLIDNASEQMPVLRPIQMPYPLSTAETVFTYYYLLRSKPDSYDGLIVVNVNVEKLLELCYETAGSEHRQLIFSENKANYYSSATMLLNEYNTEVLLNLIDKKDLVNGQHILDSEHGKIFCTWTRTEHSPFLFISCIPMSTITSQLKPLKLWLMVFYGSVLLITFFFITCLTSTMRKKYTTLQKLYDKEAQRYQDTHSYVHDTLLRNFLTSKEDYKAVTSRFLENNIDLESYTHFSLLMLEAKALKNNVSTSQNLPLRVAFPGALATAITSRYRYELVDLFQNRILLILETDDENEIKSLILKVNEILPLKCGHQIFCLYTANIPSLHQIPLEYQFLVQQAGFLYFYPEITCMNANILQHRTFNGYHLAESIGKQIFEELKGKNFDHAAELISGFFDDWFEPTAGQERTLDYLIRMMSEYINTLLVSCAVSIDFNEKTFRNKVYRCEYAADVKKLFLNLMDDLRLVVSGNSHRNRYVDAVLEIIQDDFADMNLSPELIADKIGLSASHMQSVFRSETGTSVSRYLRQYRLEKAAQLLSTTEIPVNAIPEQTGFGNQNYFFTLFKKHYGITPNEYRTSSKEE